MVNVENVRLWVDALRSGKYEQTTGALHKIFINGGSGYCCMGVACEIAIDHGLDIDVRQTPDKVFYDGNSLWLPASVAGWLGIPEEAVVVWRDSQYSLANLNDGVRLSFGEIADIIEETYLTDHHDDILDLQYIR